MKIVSGRGEDAHVTSAQFRQFIEGTVGSSSCILRTGENMEPELASNNLLRIKSGMMCHHSNISCVENGAYDEVMIQNGAQGMKRIDLVVNRYTFESETEIEKNEWVVIQGTPAESNPTVPSYIAGDLRIGDLIDDCPTYEIHLDGINVTEVKQLLTPCGSLEVTEWKELELSSNFEPRYEHSYVQYRRKNGQIKLRGVLTPKNKIAKDQVTTMFTLPEGFRPTRTEHFLNQGSFLNTWLLSVNIDGSATVQKYGTTDNSEIPAGAWLGFSCSFESD